MMEPRCLAEHEIADLVFRAGAEPGAIFNRYEVGNLLATLFEVEKDRKEFAHRLVRECLYYTYPDHPNESGWYTCAHCHASQEERERFPHAPTCIVEKARKYE